MSEKTSVDYLLRQVPAALHRRIKVAAFESGLSIRQWFLNAAEEKLKEGAEKCQVQTAEKTLKND